MIQNPCGITLEVKHLRVHILKYQNAEYHIYQLRKNKLESFSIILLKLVPIKFIVFNVRERKNIMAYSFKHIGSWKKVFDYR